MEITKAQFVSKMRNGEKGLVYDELSSYTIEAGSKPGYFLLTDLGDHIPASEEVVEVLFDWFGGYSADYGESTITWKPAA